MAREIARKTYAFAPVPAGVRAPTTATATWTAYLAERAKWEGHFDEDEAALFEETKAQHEQRNYCENEVHWAIYDDVSRVFAEIAKRTKMTKAQALAIKKSLGARTTNETMDGDEPRTIGTLAQMWSPVGLPRGIELKFRWHHRARNESVEFFFHLQYRLLGTADAEADEEESEAEAATTLHSETSDGDGDNDEDEDEVGGSSSAAPHKVKKRKVVAAQKMPQRTPSSSSSSSAAPAGGKSKRKRKPAKGCDEGYHFLAANSYLDMPKIPNVDVFEYWEAIEEQDASGISRATVNRIRTWLFGSATAWSDVLSSYDLVNLLFHAVGIYTSRFDLYLGVDYEPDWDTTLDEATKEALEDQKRNFVQHAVAMATDTLEAIDRLYKPYDPREPKTRWGHRITNRRMNMIRRQAGLDYTDGDYSGSAEDDMWGDSEQDKRKLARLLDGPPAVVAVLGPSEKVPYDQVFDLATAGKLPWTKRDTLTQILGLVGLLVTSETFVDTPEKLATLRSLAENL